MGETELETIEHRLEHLYGPVDWSRQEGVLQVAAIGGWQRAVIAIGSASPLSETDRFVLGVARARADVVVTSGAVLRAEPGLVHRLSEDPEGEKALQRWRLERLGRDRPPRLGILSRSGEIPSSHPAIRFAREGFVWTSRSGRARLGRRVGALEVIDAVVEREAGFGPAGRPADALGGALAHALSRTGVGTVLVEAGPTLARTLYSGMPREGMGEGVGADERASLDELLLSCFEGALEPQAVGPAFVSESAVRARFPSAPSERRVEDSSGRWCFRRYRRTRRLADAAARGQAGEREA